MKNSSLTGSSNDNTVKHFDQKFLSKRKSDFFLRNELPPKLFEWAASWGKHELKRANIRWRPCISLLSRGKNTFIHSEESITVHLSRLQENIPTNWVTFFYKSRRRTKMNIRERLYRCKKNEFIQGFYFSAYLTIVLQKNVGLYGFTIVSRFGSE